VRTGRVGWVGWATLLAAVALQLAGSCAGTQLQGRPPDAAAAASVGAPGLEQWVDAYAAEGGEGSASHPFRRLQDALRVPAPQRRVHLAPGLYSGPFIAADGTELVGGSAAVLTGEGTVLETRGAVTLRRLLVQGGMLGLRAVGTLRLLDVRFSGQRSNAVSVAGGSTLVAETTLFEASVSEGLGLVLEAGARVRLSGCSFEGPWRRAIDARAPEQLSLVQTRFRGPVTALHLKGGTAEATDATISEGRGPALYVMGGALRLRRVHVTGHEYALLTGTGAQVYAEDFTSSGADRAGVGVVNAEADFTRLTILSAGSYGGLQCVSSKVTVRELRASDIAGHGVSLRDGSLRLEGAVVQRTRDRDGPGGDGLQLRGGHATLTDLVVEQADGACLTAAEGAEVTVLRATLERCHTAGLVADSQAQVEAESVTVRSSEGPGAVATGDAHLVLNNFRATSTDDAAVWAECASGAQVKAWEVSAYLPGLPCIEVLKAAPTLGH
jgi:hypothetical protein